MGIARGTWPALIVLLLALTAGLARAEPLPLPFAASLPDARFQGTATVRWLGVPMYEASLWVHRATPAGSLDYSLPFVMRLRYVRPFAGRTIAEVSRAEIARLYQVPAEQLAHWHSGMLSAFPDVTAGAELAGMHVPGVGMRLFHNGQARADLPGDDFSRAFFGIWFAPQARDSSVRERLLSARQDRP